MEELGGVDALLDAFRRRDADRLQSLARNGVDLEHRDAAGRTVLLRAAEAGEPGTVQWILEAGARLDAVATRGDGGGRDALMIAAASGHGGVVDLLLGAGAAATARDAEGARAIDLAAWAGHGAIVRRLQPVSGEPPRLPPTAETSDAAARVDDRGLGRFDGEDTCLLVRAPPGEVAARWARLQGVEDWRRDAYGEEVVIRGRCFLVFRFRDHAWTVIRDTHDEGSPLTSADASCLASVCDEDVLFVHHSASNEQLRYVHFRRGVREDELTWPAPAPSKPRDRGDHDTFDDRFSDTFDDASPSPVVGPRCAGPDTVVSLADGLGRVDRRLKELDAYVPSWGRLAGESHRLEIAGLRPSAFERMDFLARLDP